MMNVASTRMRNCIAKLNSEAPVEASGNISRGRWIFLMIPELPTMEPVDADMISLKSCQAVRPVKTYIAKSGMERSAPMTLPITST